MLAEYTVISSKREISTIDFKNIFFNFILPSYFNFTY